MSEEDRYKAAVSYLKAAANTNGVGAIKFGDGEMFMFSKKTIDELKDKLDKDGDQQYAIIFIKGTIGTIQ